MAKVIYFDAEPTKKGVIRFVEDYRRGGFLRKEKIQYGIAGGYLPVIDDAQGIYVKIVRDYPNALIYYGTVADIERRLETKRFWLIGKDTGKGYSRVQSFKGCHIRMRCELRKIPVCYGIFRCRV